LQPRLQVPEIRVLNIVANNQVDIGGVSVVPEPPGGVASTINQGVVAHGSVLARIEFARPTHPGTASITLTPVFAFEQVFRYVDQDAAENWLVVGDALNEIGPDVVEAVEYVRARAPHQQRLNRGIRRSRLFYGDVGL
jgi:hypothetical protein